MEINTTTLYWLLGIGSLIVAFYYSSKTKEKNAPKIFGGFGVLFVVLAIASGGLPFVSDLVAAPIEPVTPTEPGLPTLEELACPPKVILTLNGYAVTWKTNSRTTSNAQMEVYNPDDEIGEPNVVPQDMITWASGVGSTTNHSLMQCTPYKFLYNGGAVDYDQIHPDTYLPFVDTTEGTITATGITFTDVTPVSAIDDLIEEDDVTGTINGQTTITRALAEANPIQSGADGSPADGDTLYYNITNAADGFHLTFDIGATTGNARLKDPVFCFVYPMANAFEGGEITDISVQLDSGTDLHIDSDVTSYYTSKGCIPLYEYKQDGHNWIDGGKTGTYKFTFSTSEGLMDAAGADILYFVVDDCGEHNGVDIRGDHSKATAVTVQLEILA